MKKNLEYSKVFSWDLNNLFEDNKNIFVVDRSVVLCMHTFGFRGVGNKLFHFLRNINEIKICMLPHRLYIQNPRLSLNKNTIVSVCAAVWAACCSHIQAVE